MTWSWEPVSHTRLKVAGLRSRYAGPFDFELAPGDCLAVTGPSGAGKSLMLRMLADLDPHEGSAALDNFACMSIPAPVWRRQVVYAAAESGWWLERVGDHFGTVPAQAAARLGLRQDIFDAPMSVCSTGERQRLAFLRAIELDPAVLLLDEPTGALDQVAVQAVEAMLRERLAARRILVLVTHDPAQADRLATLRGHLEAGRLSLAGAL